MGFRCALWGFAVPYGGSLCPMGDGPALWGSLCPIGEGCALWRVAVPYRGSCALREISVPYGGSLCPMGDTYPRMGFGTGVWDEGLGFGFGLQELLWV